MFGLTAVMYINRMLEMIVCVCPLPDRYFDGLDLWHKRYLNISMQCCVSAAPVYPSNHTFAWFLEKHVCCMVKCREMVLPFHPIYHDELIVQGVFF